MDKKPNDWTQIYPKKVGLATFEYRKDQESKGLEKIKEFLTKSNIPVVDVSNNSKYFSDDIDLLIPDNTAPSKIIASIEVKSDDLIAKYGNFFFEIVSNEERGTIGCFLKSSANFWFYLDNLSNVLYIFPLGKLQKWFFDIRGLFVRSRETRKLDHIFPLKSTQTEQVGKYQHTTIGRIIKREYLFKSLQEFKIPFLQKNLNHDPVSMAELESLLII